MSMISMNNLKCGLMGPKDTFQLPINASLMSLGPEKLAVFLGGVADWLVLCILVLICIVDAETNCVYCNGFGVSEPM